MRGNGRLRGPGTTNLAIGAVMLLVIVPLALQATQTPPPQIAEFSPQAQQIKTPPKEQAANVGKDSGGGSKSGPGTGGGGGSNEPTPDPSASPSQHIVPEAPIDVNRTHNCVGDPPRQIEDPQAPPCVAYWSGKDNGGATAPGVTATTITIAVPQIENTSSTELTPFEMALERFFNDRFEFYGRQLKLERLNASCGGDTTAAIRDAQDVANEMHAFASTDYCALIGNEIFYYRQLAKEKVISAIDLPMAEGENDTLGPNDPYMWSILPGQDVMQRELADLGCKLSKGPPKFGIDAQKGLSSKRSFAIVRGMRYGFGPDVTPLKDALAACGVDVGKVYDADSAITPENNASYQRIAAQLQQDAVTTVYCVCHIVSPMSHLMTQAAKTTYYPEWISGSFYLGDRDEWAAQQMPSDASQGLIGLSFANKHLPVAQTPPYWAFKEKDQTNAYSGAGGGWREEFEYRDLLLLASGIQMAGPELTPFTFRDALYRTRFPNPGAGGPPYWQATVSMGPGDHAFNSDAAVTWFSANQRPVGYPATIPGANCYLSRGRRFSLGGIPDDRTLSAGLHSGSCY
jgi:hypothetical protein